VAPLCRGGYNLVTVSGAVLVDYSALAPDELLRVCIDARDSSAWKEFIRRFNPVIARVSLRIASRFGESRGSIVDDLVQETYLRLYAHDCRLLRSFTSHEPQSLFAYLKVVTSSVAHDYFKARGAEKRKLDATAESLDEATAPSVEVRQGALTSAEKTILIQEIDKKLECLLSPAELKRARLVFWLYYRSGLTAAAIASLPGIGLTTKGVESLLFRLTRSLRESLAIPSSTGPPSRQKGIQSAESF